MSSNDSIGKVLKVAFALCIVCSVIVSAAAVVLKPAQDAFWGGHHGYFSDPDGHIWEVACNPFAPLGRDGAFQWGGVQD